MKIIIDITKKEIERVKIWSIHICTIQPVLKKILRACEKARKK